MQVKAPKDPPVPLLRGLVGPEVDSIQQGSVPAVDSPGGDVQTTGQTLQEGGRPRFVPPPAETWDRAVEQRTHVTGQAEPAANAGTREWGPVGLGLGLGLIALVGAAAALAAVRGTQRRSMAPVPVAMLRGRPDGRRKSS